MNAREMLRQYYQNLDVDVDDDESVPAWAEIIGEPARIPASRNDVECERRTPRMNFELFILPLQRTITS